MRFVFKVLKVIFWGFVILFGIGVVSGFLEKIKKKSGKDANTTSEKNLSKDSTTFTPDIAERVDFNKKNKRNKKKVVNNKKSNKYKRLHPDSGLYKTFPASTRASKSYRPPLDDKVSSLPYSPIVSESLLDFEDLNESTINKMIAKIDKESDKAWDLDNPNDVVKQLKKAIELSKELEAFCYNGGFGGRMYYHDNNLNFYEEHLETELQDYLDNDYEEADV